MWETAWPFLMQIHYQAQGGLSGEASPGRGCYPLIGSALLWPWDEVAPMKGSQYP